MERSPKVATPLTADTVALPESVLPAGLLPSATVRSEEHTSELQSHHDHVCRLLLEKKKSMTSEYANYDIGVHMHGTRNDASAKVLAALDAGCRRFDSAIGGLGGCPFFHDWLIVIIP